MIPLALTDIEFLGFLGVVLLAFAVLIILGLWLRKRQLAEGLGIRAKDLLPMRDFGAGTAYYYSVRVDYSMDVAGFVIRDHSDVEVARIAYFSGQRERRATIEWEGKTWVIRLLPTWSESAELRDENGLVRATFRRRLNVLEYEEPDSGLYVAKRRSLFSSEFDVSKGKIAVGELKLSRNPSKPRCLVVSESVPWPLRLLMLAVA